MSLLDDANNPPPCEHGQVWADCDQCTASGGSGGSVDGDAVLKEVHTFLGRFCAFPSPEAHDAVTLWAALTHMVQHTYGCPRLCLVSAEMRSGKTRVLDCLNVLVHQPMYSFGASTAALFRTIDKRQTTLLFDEVDTVFTKRGRDSDNEDMRALINEGYKRGATVARCVGPRQEVHHFKVYGAAALASIGDMPATIMDRAIVIRMRRRKPSETVEKFRDRRQEPEGHAIRDQLAAWALEVGQEVGEATPEIPPGITDRAEEGWEPLIAIADAAGGSWPQRARVAAVALVALVAEEEPGLGSQLLRCIKMIFDAQPDLDRISTRDLLGQLWTQQEQPWATLDYHGLGDRKLALLLREYQVSSRDMRINESIVKGYYRAAFVDAWERYMPAPSATGATSATDATEDPLF